MEAITKKWYDYLEECKLMGLKCKRCGAIHFPPFPICRECSGMDMEWVEVEPKGVVEELALVAAPDQWFAEYAPYYFGYGHIAGSVFNTMILDLNMAPEDTLDQFVKKLPIEVDVEIQKRDGYSYPVFRYKG